MVCLSDKISSEDPNLSMQKLESFKTLAASVHADTLSIHRMRENDEFKMILAKISSQPSYQEDERFHQSHAAELSEK